MVLYVYIPVLFSRDPAEDEITSGFDIEKENQNIIISLKVKLLKDF